MEECARCGVWTDEEKLSYAILAKGIMKVCEKCIEKENFPLVNLPTASQINESKKTVRFRDSVKQFEKGKIATKSELLKKQEITLKDIIDRNVKMRAEKKLQPRSDLIHNFHWVIMRARRARKISQKQLAKEIAEPEMSVRLAETGKFPDDDYRLARKLEGYLGIRILKKEVSDKLDRAPKTIGFDSPTTKILTIADLREMKKQELEKRKKEEQEKKRLEEKEKQEEEKSDLDDDNELTPEEVDELISRERR